MKKLNVVSMYILSFISMYVTMYAMIYVFDHALLNINKFYMAVLMVAEMGIINVFTMPKMYEKSKTKYITLAICTLAVISSFILLRRQIGVGNKQFLKAMIPHHSSAILMCEQANITDSEIEDLCEDIIETQIREIEIMEDMLKNY